MVCGSSYQLCIVSTYQCDPLHDKRALEDILARAIFPWRHLVTAVVVTTTTTMADAVPNLESVYRGIHTLYNDPIAAEKEKAGKWLEEVQKSVRR